MHSFIKPRKKKLMDDMSLLWLIFIVLMFLGLLGFGIFINYKSSFYIKAIEEYEQKNSLYEGNIQKYKKDFKIISMKQELYNEVKSNNIILKKSVKNLFDLVPDQITLTDVSMSKDELLLEGYSVSKDSYTLLLEPPLKSIFDNSEVVFSKNSHGFFSFISKNNVNNPESLKQ